MKLFPLTPYAGWTVYVAPDEIASVRYWSYEIDSVGNCAIGSITYLKHTSEGIASKETMESLLNRLEMFDSPPLEAIPLPVQDRSTLYGKVEE